MEPSRIDAERLDDLLGRARVEIDRGILPACQLALAKDGRLVAFETYGDASNETRFAIFSATKTFVCSVVWQLLGNGSLTLDQRIADLVPGFGANGKDVVTLEHVLSHSAGFPLPPFNPLVWSDVEQRHAAFAKWRLDWEPGTRFEYHALSGHWLLADIIETVTGQDFRDALRTRVIEPLGLRAFVLGGPDATHEIAPPGIVGEPVPHFGEPQHELLLTLADAGVREIGIPAGGAISTAADVAMFYQALLRSELWNPDTLRDATENVRNAHPDKVRGFPMNYGLGVRIDTGDGNGIGRGLADKAGVFGHDGAGGQIAWADPSTGISFCYLTNGLDDDLVRQWNRFGGISSRALRCASSASS